MKKYFGIVWLCLSSGLMGQDLYVVGDLDVSGEANFNQNLAVFGDLSAAHVSASSAIGYSAFYGRQIGITFTHGDPIYAAVADNVNGAANWFFSGRIGGSGGPVTFSIRADGWVRSAALSGVGDRLLQASSDGSIVPTS